MFRPLNSLVGLPQPTPIFGNVADTTPSVAVGTFAEMLDPWWGWGEFIYAQAAGAIRNKGLVTFTPVFDSTNKRWSYEATEAASTAGLGKTLAVAVRALADNEYGWFQISGVSPVNCSTTLAAGDKIAVAATGQGGTLANGKQVLNAVTAAAGSTTVVKAAVSGLTGSYQIRVAESDGWFIGAYMSGTGIAAGAKISHIDPSGTIVTLDIVHTAAVTGNITATYNNATIYYNVLQFNRPFSQGQVL